MDSPCYNIFVKILYVIKTCTLIRKNVTSKPVSCRTPIWWKIIFLLSGGEAICNLSSNSSLYLVIVFLSENVLQPVFLNPVFGDLSEISLSSTFYCVFFLQTCVDLNIGYTRNWIKISEFLQRENFVPCFLRVRIL